MIVTNKDNTFSAKLDGVSTSLLIGESNTGSSEISIQITEVEVKGSQFLHAHKEAQCYYIISGLGLMTVSEETEEVKEGDAIYIPPKERHGIKNLGNKKLVYLTSNQSFGEKIEKELWPSQPAL